MEKQCVVCKTKFDTTSSTKFCCDECRNMWQSGIKLVSNHPEIAIINARAREQGLSYGKYVAQTENKVKITRKRV